MTFFNLRGVPGFVAFAVLLVVAASSGAVAGSLITSADIKNNTIRGHDIHNETIKSRDIANGTIARADLDPSLANGLTGGGGTPGGSTPGGGNTPTTDTTPPPAPVATKDGTLHPAGAVVDWTAVTATDLAGYNLYRSTDMGGTWQKLNTALITGTTANGGNPSTGTLDMVQFAVTSVDTTGNESGHSNTVQFLCLDTLGCQ